MIGMFIYVWEMTGIFMGGGVGLADMIGMYLYMWEMTGIFMGGKDWQI